MNIYTTSQQLVSNALQKFGLFPSCGTSHIFSQLVIPISTDESRVPPRPKDPHVAPIAKRRPAVWPKAGRYGYNEACKDTICKTYSAISGHEIKVWTAYFFLLNMESPKV